MNNEISSELKNAVFKQKWNKMSEYFVREIEPVTCVKSLENLS
jgi:hypothetical protein